MKSFLHRFKERILGVLSGFDRLRLRGSLPRLASAGGMYRWLESKQLLLKDFNSMAQEHTERLRAALNRKAAGEGRPVEYLASFTNKEALVQQRRHRDGVAPSGLICGFSTLENCSSFDIYRDPKTRCIALRKRPRKCLHYYFYFEDHRFGLTQVRLQSWFPFGVNVVLNGREWLARQLDGAGIGYVRKDNCFTWVEDFRRAQRFADRQPQIHWTAQLDRLLRRVYPEHDRWFPDDSYYWTVEQSEWATDVAFRDADALAELYPQLIHRAIETFGSEDVLRFLGHRVTAQGHVPAHLKAEVTSDLKRRPEGVRLKHRVGRNSLKLYDKQGSVLRVETTLNDVKPYKSFRAATGSTVCPPAGSPAPPGIARSTPATAPSAGPCRPPPYAAVATPAAPPGRRSPRGNSGTA
jgi:hypothetical protein